MAQYLCSLSRDATTNPRQVESESAQDAAQKYVALHCTPPLVKDEQSVEVWTLPLFGRFGPADQKKWIVWVELSPVFHAEEI